MGNKTSKMFISRNFALLLSSRCISLFGDSLFIPAVLWLALESNEGNYAYSGPASAFSIPVLLATFIGVYVDRMNKRKTMIFSDWLRLALCMILLFKQPFH